MQMPVPVLGIGDYAHGVTVMSAWTTSQVVLVNDNTQGQDFFPVQRSDPWLFVDIATVTDRADDIYLLYPDGSGTYVLQPLEMVALYTNDSGDIAVRFAVHAAVRSAQEGIALMGNLPRGVSLEDVLLVMGNTGPAWRLR